MHLSDHGIRMLETAMAEARRSASTKKAGDAAAIKALRTVLEDKVIRADDLPIGTVQPERALRGHILLTESWVSSCHGDKLWGCLSGRGKHYNGMFGTIEELEAGRGALNDKDVIADLVTNAQMPSQGERRDIGTRVAIALRILCAPSVERVMPQAQRAVQRMLSEELLAHPILLHPAFLAPGAGHKQGSYVSVATSIAAGAGAALPRRRHFEGSSDKLDADSSSFGNTEALWDAKRQGDRSEVASSGTLEALWSAKRQADLFGSPAAVEVEELDELGQRLLDFAMDPCVRLGLSQSSVEVTDKNVHGRPEGGIRFRRCRLIPGTMKTAASVPGFLASVMELETLVVRHGVQRTRGEAPPQTMPFPFTVIGGLKLDDAALSHGTNHGSPDVEDKDVDDSHLVAASMVTSFYTAIGTLNVPSSVSSRPLSYRANRIDSGFLNEVKLRTAALMAQPTFQLRLGSNLKKRVFMGRFEDVSPEDADFNGRRAIEGLVAGGLAPDARAAGQFLLEHLLGQKRGDMPLPKATVEAAAAFIKVLVETGVLGKAMGPEQLDCEDSFEKLMPQAMHIVETFPGYQVPFRDVWLQAMDVVSVETRMRAVIDAVSAVPAAASAILEHFTGPMESVTPRRRRVAV